MHGHAGQQRLTSHVSVAGAVNTVNIASCTFREALDDEGEVFGFALDEHGLDAFIPRRFARRASPAPAPHR